MSRVLLDTSAYSAWKRGHRELGEALERVERLALPVVALGELRAGFRRGERESRNEHELQRLLALPGVEVLDVGDETSRRYALVVDLLRRAGAPIPTNDIWIAATALEHGLEVWTTDSDFERVAGLLVRQFRVS